MIEESRSAPDGIVETFGKPFRHYVTDSGHYIGSTDGDPLSENEVSPSPEWADQKWLFPGWAPSYAKAAAAENEWRETEMPKAQQNATAIEYGEEGIPGTAQQWQKYWLALRKWIETNPDFPDSSKRPVAPI